MIYGGTFKDTNSVTYQVFFMTNGETSGGTPFSDSDVDEELTLSFDPIDISYSSDGTLTETPVITSSATIHIVTNLPIMNLYSATNYGVRCEIFKGSDLYWVGYVTPNAYTQDYNYVNEMDIECTDALSVLKNIKIEGAFEMRYMLQALGLPSSFSYYFPVGLKIEGNDLPSCMVIPNIEKDSTAYDIIERIAGSLGLTAVCRRDTIIFLSQQNTGYLLVDYNGNITASTDVYITWDEVKRNVKKEVSFQDITISINPTEWSEESWGYEVNTDLTGIYIQGSKISAHSGAAVTLSQELHISEFTIVDSKYYVIINEMTSPEILPYDGTFDEGEDEVLRVDVYRKVQDSTTRTKTDETEYEGDFSGYTQIETYKWEKDTSTTNTSTLNGYIMTITTTTKSYIIRNTDSVVIRNNFTVGSTIEYAGHKNTFSILPIWKEWLIAPSLKEVDEADTEWADGSKSITVPEPGFTEVGFIVSHNFKASVYEFYNTEKDNVTNGTMILWSNGAEDSTSTKTEYPYPNNYMSIYKRFWFNTNYYYLDDGSGTMWTNGGYMEMQSFIKYMLYERNISEGKYPPQKLSWDKENVIVLKAETYYISQGDTRVKPMQTDLSLSYKNLSFAEGNSLVISGKVAFTYDFCFNFNERRLWNPSSNARYGAHIKAIVELEANDGNWYYGIYGFTNADTQWSWLSYASKQNFANDWELQQTLITRIPVLGTHGSTLTNNNYMDYFEWGDICDDGYLLKTIEDNVQLNEDKGIFINTPDGVAFGNVTIYPIGYFKEPSATVADTVQSMPGVTWIDSLKIEVIKNDVSVEASDTEWEYYKNNSQSFAEEGDDIEPYYVSSSFLTKNTYNGLQYYFGDELLTVDNMNFYGTSAAPEIYVGSQYVSQFSGIHKSLSLELDNTANIGDLITYDNVTYIVTEKKENIKTCSAEYLLNEYLGDTISLANFTKRKKKD